MEEYKIEKTTYIQDSKSKNSFDGDYGSSYRGVFIVEGKRVAGISIKVNPDSSVPSLKKTVDYIRVKDLARDAGELRAELAVMDAILDKANELKIYN
jgi:hypothetical protein